MSSYLHICLCIVARRPILRLCLCAQCYKQPSAAKGHRKGTFWLNLREVFLISALPASCESERYLIRHTWHPSSADQFCIISSTPESATSNKVKSRCTILPQSFTIAILVILLMESYNPHYPLLDFFENHLRWFSLATQFPCWLLSATNVSAVVR